MRLRAAFLSLAAGIACGHLTDPPLPLDAERFAAPPVYTKWWAMLESCSGLKGSLDQVQWFATTGPLQNPENGNEYLAGYWSRASNRIVLLSNDTIDGRTVRHEMLHALVRTGGHPRSMFLENCGGLVDCGLDCIQEAGPPPAVVAGTPIVTPAQVEVTVAVSPLSPSASADNGLATFTISVRNPFPYAIVVALPRRGLDINPASYRAAFQKPDGTAITKADFALDNGVTQFAAGETKRDVIDFAVTPNAGQIIHGLGTFGIALPPGSYSFRGAYGGRFGPDVGVVLTQ